MPLLFSFQPLPASHALKVLLILLLLAAPVHGAEPDSTAIGDTVVQKDGAERNPTRFDAGDEIRLSQKHDGDLYLAGRTVEVRSDIAGDLTAAAEEIRISERIGADLLASGASVKMSGRVEDDMRVFAGELDLSGHVGGDLLVFGGELELQEGAVVDGMVKVYGGSVVLRGKVRGDVDIAGGNLEHRGSIGSDLRLRTGKTLITGTVKGKSELATRSLQLGEGAAFHDDVKYWRQDGEVDLSPYMKSGEADLDPALKDEVMGDVGWTVLLFGFWAAWIIYILSAALMLFLLNYFLTRSFKRAGIALAHLGKSLGFGALYVFGLPIASLILLITVIGAPIALVAGTIWGLSMLFTHLLSAVVITHWLKMRYNKAWDRVYLFLVTFGIYLVLKAISLIPFLGFLFSIFIVLACFGAILLARRALFTNRPMVRI